MCNLYTVGHSNMAPEQFIELLHSFGIKKIVDVRTAPYSKYVKWANREPLRQALGEAGIQYVYGGKVLGGRAPHAVDDPLFLEKLGKVVELSKEMPVAMMCSEKNPNDCHRTYKLCSTIHRVDPEVKMAHILGMGSSVDTREQEITKPSKWVASFHETPLTGLI